MDENHREAMLKEHWATIARYGRIMDAQKQITIQNGSKMSSYSDSLIDRNYDASLIAKEDWKKNNKLMRYALNLFVDIVAAAGPKNDIDLGKFFAIVFKKHVGTILNLVCAIDEEAQKYASMYMTIVDKNGFKSQPMPARQLYDANDLPSGVEGDDLLYFSVFRMRTGPRTPLDEADYTIQVYVSQSKNLAQNYPLPPQHFKYLHFKDWIDNGTISPNMINSLADILIASTISNGPVLVHCAAGIGRTGTVLTAYLLKLYIQSDILIKPLNNKNIPFSIDDVIFWLRQYRRNMVFTFEQYVSLYSFLQTYASQMQNVMLQATIGLLENGFKPVDAEFSKILKENEFGKSRSRLDIRKSSNQDSTESLRFTTLDSVNPSSSRNPRTSIFDTSPNRSPVQQSLQFTIESSPSRSKQTPAKARRRLFESESPSRTGASQRQLNTTPPLLQSQIPTRTTPEFEDFIPSSKRMTPLRYNTPPSRQTPLSDLIEPNYEAKLTMDSPLFGSPRTSPSFKRMSMMTPQQKKTSPARSMAKRISSPLNLSLSFDQSPYDNMNTSDPYHLDMSLDRFVDPAEPLSGITPQKIEFDDPNVDSQRTEPSPFSPSLGLNRIRLSPNSQTPVKSYITSGRKERRSAQKASIKLSRYRNQ